MYKCSTALLLHWLVPLLLRLLSSLPMSLCMCLCLYLHLCLSLDLVFSLHLAMEIDLVLLMVCQNMGNQHQWGKMCCRNSLEERTISKQVWMSLISGEMFVYGAYDSLNKRQHFPLSSFSNASQILSSKLSMQRIPRARWSITRNNLCSIFLSVVSFLSSTNSCHYCHQLDAITCHRGMLTFIAATCQGLSLVLSHTLLSSRMRGDMVTARKRDMFLLPESLKRQLHPLQPLRIQERLC